jgi:polyisoprenoid-binding protein YceI
MIWNIDTSHATVGFSVKHMAISTVRGAFNVFTGSGETDAAGVPTSIAMEIDATSISTNNEQRDAHLKSPDFFDVATFPKLAFRSTRISGTRDDLTIVGDLTIRGVTKTVTLAGELSQEVKDPWGNQRTSIVATGKLSREQFGLTWNMALEFGGVMVSDEVKLHIEVEAVAVAPVAA